MILVIDNYDSFTWNLVQYFGALSADPLVRRNDEITVDEIRALKPRAVVLSPGPKSPAETEPTNRILRELAGQIPILGVCLGHQCIGHVFGARIRRADRLMHGKTSDITHDGEGLFLGMPDPFTATRYHSLIVDRESLPPELIVTAETDEREIMGLKHRDLPVWGVQFHPESILTQEGMRLLRNFLDLAGVRSAPGATAEDGGVAGVSEAIAQVADGRHLHRALARTVIGQVMEGAASPAQIGALLMGLRMKGETLEEIAGAAEAMRRFAIPVSTSRRPLLDTCGTGGDGQQTVNVSTATAIVAASCGVAVAKHGNRSVSSRSGSADVLEAAGVKIDLTPEQMGRCLDETGFAFLFAPALHKAMRHAAGPRREMRLRTLFNLLGPLTNPAGAEHQLLGVYDAGKARLIAGALRLLGTKRAWVVHGCEGLDELSIAGESLVFAVERNQVEERRIQPEDAGLSRQGGVVPRGGDPPENARWLWSLLEGEVQDATRPLVLLNAAAALVVAGVAADLKDGRARAEEALRSGAAVSLLRRVRDVTQRL